MTLRKSIELSLLVGLSIYCNAPAQVQAKSPTYQGLQLSLQEIWQKAESQNKSLQIQQVQLEISEQHVKDSKAERLPEIGTHAEYARISNMPIYSNGPFNTPEHFPVLHNFYQITAESYLALYHGNKINTAIETEEMAHKLAIEKRNQIASETRLKLAAIYLDLQRSLVFRDLINQHIHEAQSRLQHIQELQKNGVVLKSDLLRAELQLSRQQMTLTEIENSILLANQKLDLMIGLPDTTKIIPSEDLTTSQPIQAGYEAYLTEALEQAYPIHLADKETAIRELHIKEVRAGHLPKVGLFANYTYSYPQIFLYPYMDAAYSIGKAGIRLSYSLSSLYHNRHKEEVAILEYKKQQLVKADTEDNIRQTVKESYVRYAEALKRIQVAALNIRQSSENYRIVSNTYFNQLALLTDLLDADTQVLQSKFDLTTAQTTAHLHYYQLLFTLGKL
ncbi:TolC family protein [Cytophagaceae bacterium YF14B1]|uniref:TolC family protein n=1 Tax=Xanthocytophaga flava TaxID=3048013 RepID=A0AAE3QSE8_9BACT|nr:TolC family protein [Xanthocytophaga flavus]MDJ1481823.1 TolC family protein [Xanthocytophaga flavus]